jgi:hypothetical protein
MTKLSNLTKVTTVGDDALFYIVDPARSAGDRSVGMGKDDVKKLVGGGAVVSKTGTTIQFTEDAFYNEITFLTSGNLTLDLTGAVLGATVWIYCDRYTPSITGDYLLTGTISSSALNILVCTYDGQKVQISNIQKSYLATPSLSVTSGDVENLLNGFAVTNATSYSIKFNTVDDEATATDVPGYNGTDTIYSHTGLTNGQIYYYYVKASASGFLQSATGTGNGTPALPVFNTEIGGVGLTYSNESQLATLLGITAGDISDFAVDVNNNITCDINVNYTLPNQTFLNNTDITYYKDSDGRCTAVSGSEHFRGCSSLLYIDMHGDISPIAWSCSSLEYINLPNNTGSYYARSCGSLKWQYSPLATSINSYALSDAESIESVSGDLVTSVLGNAFRDLTSKLILEFPIITTISSVNALYFCSNSANIFLFNSVTTFGVSGMLRNFNGTLYIPNLTSPIGGVNGDSGTLLNCGSSTVIYANNALSTINGGGIDGDLAYVQSRGGTVIFITNTTPPSAVSDLSTSNITSSSVDLTFTTPSSTNTIGGYDVYIDRGDGAGYRLIQTMSASGETIPTLISGNETKIKLKTYDEFRNRSAYSNEVTFTVL